MAQRRRQPLTLLEAFGQALREAREGAELSQEELGFQSGAHRTYISELERGLKCPSLETIEKLAKAMAIRASLLVARAEDIRESEPRTRS